MAVIGTLSDEFADEGSLRGQAWRPGRNAVQEREDLGGLLEVRVLGRHLLQERLDEGLEHGNLVLCGRVHDEVSIVLVREDPDALASPHVVPHAQSAGSRVASEQVVAAHPSQQPVVSGLHDVGVIQLKGRQRRDENLENLLAGHILGVEGIERMDTLDDQNAIVRQRWELGSLPITVASLHVVVRNHHGVSRDDVIDVLIHQIDVHRLDVVIVDVRALLASLILGLSIQRQVVVVDRHRLRDKPHIRQVHAQLRSESSLAGRCGTGDTNDLHRLALVSSLIDHQGDRGQLLLLS
mmetsp:Transcript_85185/g.178024  ORF Transcript_85185/g.178024 Transcript_85185/m.178024 type:complete len:295 (+) Transcript_85185:165-1049(+)